MVNFYIYAKDYSGSTEMEAHYHNNGLKTLDDFKNDVEKIQTELVNAGEPVTKSKIIYLHWGQECNEIDEDTARAAYLSLRGDSMDTKPSTIIEWVKQHYNICGENNKIKLLYIITDGLIDRKRAKKCFLLNQDTQYERVVFHAFNTYTGSIDMSVAASFLKKQCKVYCNYELYDSIDISEEFDYDQINVDNFTAERDNLKSYIKLKFIRNVKHDARALQEIDKLKKLRNKLFNELSKRSEKIPVNLETKDKNTFLQEFCRTNWYQNLILDNNMMKTDIEKSITTMINYIVSDKKSYAFDAMKFETIYDESVEVEPIVDTNFADTEQIAFPDIILDDEKGIPVVILTEFNLLNKIIFHITKESDQISPASFSKFKSTMECPLFLINDSDISESIGYFYTLNVYKQLLENGRMTEPRTRRPFHGGIVLIDDDQIDKYNDYVLSATYFDSKKVNYNVGLFYFLLWKNCEKMEWMDKNVVERFKKYAMRRISQTVCKIGLSCLPLDPQENTSLLTALWYCVELSTCIFKDDAKNFNHERLRLYSGVANHMIEILKYFDYDLDLESIEKRIDLIRHVMILKKMSRPRDKVYYLLERIFKNVDGLLVNKIEKPFNLYTLNYLKVNHKGMLRDDVCEEKVHLSEYVHLLHREDKQDNSEFREDNFEICDKTFRPYFVIDENKSFYTELVKNLRKVVIKNDDDKDNIEIVYEPVDTIEFDKMLSLYNLFLKCVKDLDKYPTLAEYIEYIGKKKKFCGDLVSIFDCYVHRDAENVYNRYQNIVNKVDVKEFIAVCKSTVNRIDRIKAEDRIKFNSDNEINKYIADEEFKVNMKKQ